MSLCLCLIVTSNKDFFIKQTRESFCCKKDLLLVSSETNDDELIKDVLKGMGWISGAFYEICSLPSLLDDFTGKIITVKIRKE